jgi:hypothetical protein
MTPTTLVTTAAEVAEPVAWEPCAEARPGEPGAGLCDRCGWPLEDHTPRGGFAVPRAA